MEVREIPLSLLQQGVGHGLVHQHGRVAQRKGVAAVGGQLHGVFEEAGPSGEPRPREIGSPGVAVHDGCPDLVKVQSFGGGDVIKLVGSAKGHIPPGVQEEFCGLQGSVIYNKARIIRCHNYQGSCFTVASNFMRMRKCK